MNKDQALEALATIQDSTSTANLVTLGHIKKLAACDGHISVTISCTDDAAVRKDLEANCRGAIMDHARKIGAPVERVAVEFVTPESELGSRQGIGADERIVDQPKTVSLKQASSSPTASKGTVTQGSAGIPGVKHTIAVGAGKGGVGKSTVAVNLAVGLARQGYAVGLLDADIYGPSLPTMLGLQDHEVLLHENMLQVFYMHGIKAMTIGKLVDPEKPLIWRGPMAHGAFKQLAEQTDWGELDYLIVDLPPGTGDVPLTMSQMLRLTGAVVVCTPQQVAQDDAVRAVRMFQQLRIECLGIVENMSYFVGDDGKSYDIFGRGGAELMAQRLGLPFLGAIPISIPMRKFADAGTPSKNFTDAGPEIRAAIEKFVTQTERQAMLADANQVNAAPTMTVS